MQAVVAAEQEGRKPEGQKVVVFDEKAQHRSVYEAAVSPDGKWFATAGEG